MNTSHMFSGSHNFSINGGNFVVNQREAGISELHKSIATSALLDAEARYPPPLCHPGTRAAILSDLRQWADASSTLEKIERIRWLYGPAGAGKSAIAQTLAEYCAKKGTLAAAFFFFRSDPTRNHPTQLFPTIAYQLAFSMPNLRPIINSIMENNLSIVSSSIETQAEKLILQPFSRVPTTPQSTYERDSSYLGGSPMSDARILIIDGLDECSDSRNQQRVISILGKAMSQDSLPLRILIASRPEPRIKNAFCDSNMRSVCRWMGLNDNYSASCDIRRFLQDGFRDILHHHSHSMEHILRPWPTPDQIEQLVQKASGQFIFPSTVLKYIDDDCAVPADRLDIVLGLQPVEGNKSPFADLDALYHQVLSTSDNPAKLIHVLGAIFVIREKEAETTLVPILSALVEIPKGVLQAIFFGVHSLFQPPSPVDSDFKFTHASFTDFLFERGRSLNFFVDKYTAHDYVARACLKALVEEYTKFGQDDPSFTFTTSPAYSYASKHWFHHCLNANGSDELVTRLESLDIYALVTTQLRCLRFQSSTSSLDIHARLPRLRVLQSSTRIDIEQFADLLEGILKGVFDLWIHLRDKHGVDIKPFQAMTTSGFCLVSCPRSEKDSKRITILLAPDLYTEYSHRQVDHLLRFWLRRQQFEPGRLGGWVFEPLNDRVSAISTVDLK